MGEGDECVEYESYLYHCDSLCDYCLMLLCTIHETMFSPLRSLITCLVSSFSPFAYITVKLYLCHRIYNCCICKVHCNSCETSKSNGPSWNCHINKSALCFCCKGMLVWTEYLQNILWFSSVWHPFLDGVSQSSWMYQLSNSV